MARGKSYSNEEIMLLQTLRRLEQNGICSRQYILDTAWEITGRTQTAIQSQLSRMSNPHNGWASIDKLLSDVSDETLTSENVKAFIGTVHKVKCDAVTPYGAFCHTIDTNIKGLLHISRISFDYIDDIQNHIKLNDEFYVTIAEESAPGRVAFTRLDVPDEYK